MSPFLIGIKKSSNPGQTSSHRNHSWLEREKDCSKWSKPRAGDCRLCHWHTYSCKWRGNCSFGRPSREDGWKHISAMVIEKKVLATLDRAMPRIDSVSDLRHSLPQVPALGCPESTVVLRLAQELLVSSDTCYSAFLEHQNAVGQAYCT